jgi:DNA replication protein DnaC
MAIESYEKLTSDLKKLKLSSMAQMLDSFTKQAVSNSMSYMDFLSGLVSEEIDHRERRGIENRIKSARFPVLKSIADFDYAFQPSVSRKKLEELSSLRFIDNKENILFLGPPGVGKTQPRKCISRIYSFYWRLCDYYRPTASAVWANFTFGSYH